MVEILFLSLKLRKHFVYVHSFEDSPSPAGFGYLLNSPLALRHMTHTFCEEAFERLGFPYGSRIAYGSAPVENNPTTFAISDELSLIYVLYRSGCHGRLTGGRIERLGETTLKVYDAYGTLFEYLSGDALRSWCVIDILGKPVNGWRAVQPEDVDHVLSYGNADDGDTLFANNCR